MKNLSAPRQTIRFGVLTANPLNISSIRTICFLLLGTIGLLLLAQVRAQDPSIYRQGIVQRECFRRTVLRSQLTVRVLKKWMAL